MPIEPLEARWIKSPYGLYGVTWQCSYCWHTTTFLMGDVESEDVLQFCPKCGAAMTKEAEGAKKAERTKKGGTIWHDAAEVPAETGSGLSKDLVLEMRMDTCKRARFIEGWMDGSKMKFVKYSPYANDGGGGFEEIPLAEVEAWAYAEELFEDDETLKS